MSARTPDGRVLACNDVAVRLFGAKSQFELLGVEEVLAPGYEVRTEAGELLHPPDFPSLRVLSTGEPEVGPVLSLTASDGSSKWLRIAAQPIRSSTGAITGSVTTFTDVTERVSAQKALRASSARLDLALAAARMGVWEFDPITDVGYWSDNLDSIFQLGPREQGLAGFLRWTHPDDRESIAANSERAIFAADGDSFDSEFRLVGQDGVTRWARVHGRTSREGGRVHMAGTIRDVTEQHRLEEELRRAHRLESIGRLAGGIAHDFNNRLAAMMGSLGELVRNTAVRMLRSLGYDVLSAGSGGEAIERAQRHTGPIDVAFCDVAMPGQDGPSVVRELKKLRPGLKVLFASGYAAEPDDENLLGNVFLAKPYTRSELAAKLHEVLAD